MTTLSNKAAAIDETLANLETQLADFLVAAEARRQAAQSHHRNPRFDIVEGDRKAAAALAHARRVVDNTFARAHARARGDAVRVNDTLANVFQE